MCDENGAVVSDSSSFARPADIASNGRSYLIGFHYAGDGVSCVKMYNPVET